MEFKEKVKILNNKKSRFLRGAIRNTKAILKQ